MIKKTIAAATIFLVIMSTFMMFNLTTFATNPKPVDLKIYVSPSSILADNSSNTCIFVQLMDANGNPARAEQATTIDLSSSAPGIGIVDQTTIIPKNGTYASANFTSTYLPGTTTITATAPNYATVTSTLTTIGPYPYKTTVYGFPTVLPANGGTYSAVMVQLQDSNGLPARAPNNVNVSLFSSNVAVGTVNSSITILQGQTFAIANFTSTITEGDTTITALGHGYASTQLTFTTAPVPGSSAGQLKIFEGPPQVLADNNVYRQIAVELQDSSVNHYPTTLPGNTTVTIASSDNTIVTTDNEITIPAGSTYALANLYTTYRAGTVTITAATNGLSVASQTLTTVGYTPSQLAVLCAPSDLPADNQTYPAVQVQLQDDQGRPARNPDSGTILKLFSSDLAVGDVLSPIAIPLGATQATGNFTLTNTPGTTTITAIASNYTTGQGDITTYFIDYRPMQTTVTVNPDHVNGANSVQVSAYLTGDGNPITGAQVSFASNIGGTFSAVQTGSGYYNVTFTTPNLSQTAICTITVNASKTLWLDSAGTAQITVAPAVTPTPTPTATPAPTATPTPTPTPTSSPNATSSPTPTPTPTPEPSTSPNSTDTTTPQSTSTTNGVVSIQLLIQDSNGYPLSGTSVASTAQPGGAQILSAVTNETGFVTFENVKAGSYTFQVSKEGYQLVSQTFNTTDQESTHTILLSNAEPVNSQGKATSPLLIPVIAGVIVIVAVVVSLLFVKRHWNIKLSSSS
jgi:hypothetical protein